MLSSLAEAKADLRVVGVVEVGYSSAALLLRIAPLGYYKTILDPKVASLPFR